MGNWIRKIKSLIFYLIGVSKDSSSVFNYTDLHRNSKYSIEENSTVSLNKSIVSYSTIRTSGDSKLEIDKNSTITNSTIIVQNNSSLIIDKNVNIDGFDIQVINDSSFHIKDNCQLKKLKTNIQAAIYVVNGSKAVFQEKVKISSDLIRVNFGGSLSIGILTGIGERTEIRCENEITIGAYCLISTDVSIYDTNAHSLNHNVRKKRIEECFPNGVWENDAPDTKSISIGDFVWIGKGCYVAKGASIGQNSILGMGANIGGSKIPNNSICVSEKPRILINSNTN